MTQTQSTRQISFIQAINEALRQEMTRDPDVIVMGEDIAGGGEREDCQAVSYPHLPLPTTPDV